MASIQLKLIAGPLALIAAAAVAGAPAVVWAQARGGPPPGIPAGPPTGLPSNPGGRRGFPDIPAHGPPPWANDASENRADGIARAELARSQAISAVQRKRAAARANANPDAYELDRSGALAIRGEVLATGLNAADFAKIERHGFSVIRRQEVEGLGTTLAVLNRANTPVARALDLLRRVAPNGIYAPNHVMFESGAARPTADPQRETVGRALHNAKVGMIDTEVAPSVGQEPGVRLFSRNFTGAAGRPELHGTAVAELIARPTGNITIYAAAIFGGDAHDGTSELLIRALGWMAAQRVPVINVSMVGPANPIVGVLIGKLISLGFTIVAPVGNDGPAAKLLFPASYPGVVAVSGAGADGRILPEASRVRRVDFVAPGIAMIKDQVGRQTQVRGTSFAAPIVSRLLANDIAMPDRKTAMSALATLAKKARRPARESRWYGYGLIGEASGQP